MPAPGNTDYEQKTPFFGVLQYSIIYTSRNHQELWSIFKQVSNRLFLDLFGINVFYYGARR